MPEEFDTSDLPPSVRLIAVCRTPGCPAEGQEHEGTYYPYGDYDPPRYMGQCGPCQQPITDLRPTQAPAPATDPAPAPEEVPVPTPVPVEASTA